MGLAGAITSRSSGTAGEKIAALHSGGVRVELNPARSKAVADGKERKDVTRQEVLRYIGMGYSRSG
jgi:succinyl-CoA synthetase alpha subunit